jgi:hypothetical protein
MDYYHRTEMIEWKGGSIRCSREEASSTFDFYKKSGVEVAWYTVEPCLSLVMAHFDRAANPITAGA